MYLCGKYGFKLCCIPNNLDGLEEDIMKNMIMLESMIEVITM